MSAVYEKPPIIEALCEFRFLEDEWDWTIPGLMYQEIKDEFPKKQEQQQVEFEVQAESKSVSQRLKGGPGRMQFLRTDGSALVQVGPKILVVNHLAPYPTWGDFSELIFRTLDVYSKIATPNGFDRIGLRYINRINVPNAFSFKDYFNYYPGMPEGVTSPIGSILMRVALDYSEDSGTMVLTLANSPDDEASTSAFILDLDFSTTAANELDEESARQWIQLAHNRIETVFEASITDNLRASFGEEE